MADVKPIIFDIFINWLYTKKLREKFDEIDVLQKEVGEKIDSDTDDRFVSATVMAYALGDRLLARSFQRDVLDGLIKRINEFSKPFWFNGTAYAFDSLPEHSPMLQGLVDIHCRYLDAKGYNDMTEREKRLSESVSVAFWMRVMKKFALKSASDDWWNEPLNPCDYHEHATAEEREQCAAKK